jgi:hypothetical protein
VAHEFEVLVIKKLGDVSPASRVEIVDTKDLMALAQQSFAQVRAKKSSPTSDQNVFGMIPATDFQCRIP